MPELVCSIPTLSRSLVWNSAKQAGVVTVVIEGQEVQLNLIPRRTPVAVAMALRCPTCSSAARDIWRAEDGHLGCYRCLKLRAKHPANRLSGSAFNKSITRPILQLQGISARLEQRGLGQNLRRRLKRRRDRLLRQLEQTLLAREEKLQADVEGLLSMMANAE